MHVTQHISYGWRNYFKQYWINCTRCGKTMTRTVSDGCNEMADMEYREGIVQKLEAEAKRRAETEQEVCEKCLKAKLPEKSPCYHTN
jgi:PHP family Zn ribbon phosphoesterase